MAGPDKSAGESPESMKERARKLREAAGKAKTLAGPLGTHLDKVVTSATADKVWHGPFATDSTASLQRDQKKLRQLAADLIASASEWVREAEKLEAAAKAATPTPAPK